MPVTARSGATSGTDSRIPVKRSPVDARPDPKGTWDDEYRWDWIAENAYYRAVRRGFQSGYEVDDWLAAERDLELLRQRTGLPDI